MKSNKLSLTLWSVICFSIMSCSTTKHLREGEKLYVEGDVKLEMDSNVNVERKEAFEEHLEGLLMPKPNKKL